MATLGLIPERKDVDLIGNVYDEAAGKLTKIFLSVEPIQDFKTSEIPGLLKRVRSIVNRLDRFSIKWSRDSVTDAYDDAETIAITKLRALKREPDPDFDESIRKITKDKFSEATTEDLVQANQSIIVTANIYFEIVGRAAANLLEIQAWDMRDEEVISDLLDDAIRKGESRGTVGKRIREHFRGIIGEEQYIRINARNYNMKHYSRMVARTRLRKVQSQSTRNTCDQYENDLVEISDHGSLTEVCLPFQGKVFSLNGTTPGFDLLSEEPPYHPNCMHTMAATSEAAIEVRRG